MLLCAINGHTETAQSTVIGTIFTPAHWVAEKVSDGIDFITKSAKGNAEYEEKIDELQSELGELQNQLADYENLKTQNELYKEALELKEENEDFEYTEASVIGRDSADPYCSFTINKGTVNGVDDGYAVLYGKYLIGVIKKAYPTYSVVTTIIDPDFSVSAYDINTKELSYVTGDASLAKNGYCKFENLDSATKITYGSIIATAGISSTMPKGIIIGTVKEINNEETNISTYASIEPGTDIESVDSCLVLTSYTPESEGK
jgi:rod shape-determining protein MreC